MNHQTLLPPDARHGISLPTGYQLASVLQRIFSRMRAEVVAALRAGRSLPDLARWLPVMVDYLSPIVSPMFRHGARREILHLAHATGRQAVVHRSLNWLRQKKADHPTEIFHLVFDLFNPRIDHAIQEVVFDFCRETLDTLAADLNDGLANLREQLGAGLREGEAGVAITDRVLRIFGDPMRARRIAETESSRVTHAGQLLADRESGVVEKRRWLASGDACERCLALDGKEVALDEPFDILTTGNPAYRVIWHPPLHPHCMCTATAVI